MASVVLQTSFLGDMILTTPLIERLAQDGPVHVVATPANAGILANHPAVASVIVFDKRGGDRGFGGVLRVARAVRAVGAQRAFMAQGSVRTAAIARLAGIRERVGFATSPGRVFYTRQVPFNAQWHHAQRLWQLASPAGGRETPPVVRPSLFPGDTDHAQVEALLAAAGVAPSAPLIALAPGSVWATKRWPSFAEFAAALVTAVGLTGRGTATESSGPRGATARLVVLGAANDRPLADAIAQAVARVGGVPVIDATGALSLLGSAALLSRAMVLITNDSAPLHLASAMDTPTVALFGPTVPAFGFGPLATHQTVVEHASLPCRPCHAHGPMTCPLGHWECMRMITPARVVDVTRALLSTPR